MSLLPPHRDDPEQALSRGRWVKWIGGASNQDLSALEDLAGIYSLAGVHCLDVAADAAVVAASRRGIAWACRHGAPAPWLMLSLSDGADPHFRKAWFDPRLCPDACPRPCERVCPAAAIPAAAPGEVAIGVVAERCYGCGRCLAACPLALIEERQQLLAADAVPSLVAQLAPDAIEIHTRPGRAAAFADRLDQVCRAGVPLRRLAVSCGLEPAAGGAAHQAVPVSAERLAAELWQRFAALRSAGLPPLWQLDGRPMSGDVGDGTAHAAVRLLQRLRPQAPPGPLQLAGGTNERTLPLLRQLGGGRGGAAGVAFGSVARSLLLPLLQEAQDRGVRLLDAADLWPRALARAQALVHPWLAPDP